MPEFVLLLRDELFTDKVCIDIPRYKNRQDPSLSVTLFATCYGSGALDMSGGEDFWREHKALDGSA